MSTRITLTYSGARIKDERGMPAIHVASAIRGMAELVTRTGKLLHGKDTQIATNVEPHFRKGSFEIFFLLDAVKGIELSTLGTIVFLLFGRKYPGILDLFSRRPPDAPADRTVEEKSPIATLQKDKRVRDSADRIARPVTDRGVAEELVIRDRSRMPMFERTRIHQGHFHWPKEGPADIYVAEERLRVIKPSFRPRTMWQLQNTSGQRISAYMADREFMKKVLAREVVFGDGDELIVSMEIEVKSMRGRLLVKHRIVRVHDHQPGTGA